MVPGGWAAPEGRLMRLRFDPIAIVLLMASAVCFYLAFHIH